MSNWTLFPTCLTQVRMQYYTQVSVPTVPVALPESVQADGASRPLPRPRRTSTAPEQRRQNENVTLRTRTRTHSLPITERLPNCIGSFKSNDLRHVPAPRGHNEFICFSAQSSVLRKLARKRTPFSSRRLVKIMLDGIVM